MIDVLLVFRRLREIQRLANLRRKTSLVSNLLPLVLCDADKGLIELFLTKVKVSVSLNQILSCLTSHTATTFDCSELFACLAVNLLAHIPPQFVRGGAR